MKKMVIGLMIGLTIGYAASAYAAVGDTVSAVFAQFSYIVNGTDKAIDSPVLVYDGASYVRTTDIANMLGFDVTYKADSRTIAFNNGVTPSPTKAPISSATVTDITYTPTPSPTPDPSAIPTPTPSASPTPSPTASPSPTPTVSPVPTPIANYPGYNAAVSRLRAEVVAKNNKLYEDWDHAYRQYEGTVTAQIAYDSMQGNIKINNDQMELDILALKFQYNIPAQYNP